MRLVTGGYTLLFSSLFASECLASSPKEKGKTEIRKLRRDPNSIKWIDNSPTELLNEKIIIPIVNNVVSLGDEIEAVGEEGGAIDSQEQNFIIEKDNRSTKSENSKSTTSIINHMGSSDETESIEEKKEKEVDDQKQDSSIDDKKGKQKGSWKTVLLRSIVGGNEKGKKPLAKPPKIDDSPKGRTYTRPIFTFKSKKSKCSNNINDNGTHDCKIKHSNAVNKKPVEKARKATIDENQNDVEDSFDSTEKVDDTLESRNQSPKSPNSINDNLPKKLSINGPHVYDPNAKPLKSCLKKATQDRSTPKVKKSVTFSDVVIKETYLAEYPLKKPKTTRRFNYK